MNFAEWLSDYKIGVSHKLGDIEFSDLENIVGKQFWICDYRLNPDKSAKAIRNVPPKLVQVFDCDTFPTKRVYYSPVYFKEVKNGKILSTVIAPFDNTGYRGYTGVSLNIFETESECKKHFTDQCNTAISEYKEELLRRTKEITEKICDIERLKAENVI